MDFEDIDMIGSYLICILKKKEEMQEIGVKLEESLSDKLEKMII